MGPAMRALGGSAVEQAAAQAAAQASELRALGAAMVGLEARLAGRIAELGADVRRGLQLPIFRPPTSGWTSRRRSRALRCSPPSGWELP